MTRSFEAVDDGEEEVLLAGEVLVDRAAGEPGGLGDLLEGRALEAAPGEDLGGRGDQHVAGLLAPPFPGELLDRHRLSIHP